MAAKQACSTPCGVTTVGGQDEELPRCRVSALNALRRHCGWRSARTVRPGPLPARAQRLAASLRLAVGSNGSSWASSSACSTPCGVTAVGGMRDWARLCSQTSAQRLAASLRLADRPRRTFATAQSVLNALRRHCGWRNTPGACREASPWCSTPCGVTAVGGAWKVRAWATTPMCSTPCGVTAVCGSGRRRDGPESSAQRLAASLRLADTFAAAPPFAISR